MFNIMSGVVVAFIGITTTTERNHRLSVFITTWVVNVILCGSRKDVHMSVEHLRPSLRFMSCHDSFKMYSVQIFHKFNSFSCILYTAVVQYWKGLLHDLLKRRLISPCYRMSPNFQTTNNGTTILYYY